jgi:tRNA-2-methylthio-N6-dimethylallyladenosine synthase
VEGPAKKGDKFVGKTRGYRNSIFDGDERLIGQLAQMKVDRATASTIYGDLVLAGVDTI